MRKSDKPTALHLFLDEAGDTTFFGKKRRVIVGSPGVSNWFILGMVHFGQPLSEVRKSVQALVQQVAADAWYADVPSVQKKIRSASGYYFHATDDPMEVRKMFFEFILSLGCRFEAVAGLKIPEQFETVHRLKEGAFYADILSHCLQNHLENEKLILNIAQRGKTTKNVNLELALELATRRHTAGQIGEVVFNVQNQTAEPLLMIADYCCWALQRELERGESRYLNYIKNVTVEIKKLEQYGFLHQ